MRKLVIPDFERVIERYKAGRSLLALASETGVPRPTLTRHLRNAGVLVRGQSEAERIKWIDGRSTPERQLRAAHAARRGQRDSQDVKAARAKSWERRPDRVGRFEVAILNALDEAKGQFPVGPYNVDIAVPGLDLAIEVYTSKSSAYGRLASFNRARFAYLRAAGWRVAIIFEPSEVNAKACVESIILGGFDAIDGSGHPLPSDHPHARLLIDRR